MNTIEDLDLRIEFLRKSIGEMTYKQQEFQAMENDFMIESLERKILSARNEVARLENKLKLIKGIS